MEERSAHSSTSDINSEEIAKSEHTAHKKRICLVGAASHDPALGTAAQQFSVPVLKSETGVEYVEDSSYCTYFILKKFEGFEYDFLLRSGHRILGPTALLQLAEKKESLPSISRPMYSRAMCGNVVNFTGFRLKDELTKWIAMIHHMGGSVRKDIGSRSTHLIANSCSGDKYRYAVTFRVPIMSVDWIYALWDMRDDPSCYSGNEELMVNFKLKPFHGARVCFLGFPEEEKKHMCEVLQQQGGEPTEITDPNCTHVVSEVGNHHAKLAINSLRKLPWGFDSPNEILQSEQSLFGCQKTSYPASSSFSSLHINTILSPTIYLLVSPFKISFVSFNEIEKMAFSEESFNSDLLVGTEMYSKNRSSIKSLIISENIEEENISNRPLNLVKSRVDVSEYKDMKIQPLPVTWRPTYKKSISLNDSEKVKTTLPRRSYSYSTSVYNGMRGFSARRHIKEKRSFLSHMVSRQFLYPRSSIVRIRSYSGRKYFCPLFISNHSIGKNISVDFDCLKVNSDSQKDVESFSWTLNQSTLILSRISEITFLPTSKQQMPTTPCHLSDGNGSPQEKYTPLPSPLPVPAKMARVGSITDSRIRASQVQAQKLEISSFNVERDSTGRKTSGFGETSDKSFLVVVDESNVNTLPDLVPAKTQIVKAEWFWTSVQNEGAADEKEYLFEDYLESVNTPSAPARRDSQQAATPTTASTRRKRKRLAETLSNLVQNGVDSPGLHKRRSSVSDAGHLSVSGSFLDCTASPDKQLLDDIPEVETVSTDSARKNLSPRHQVFLELVQTESNYVGILSTIMTLFKSPLEDLIEKNGELLNSTEAKIIFGNFPPIYEVHKKMLEELRYCAAHWTEETSIGNIFLKYAPDLIKAYPPYVNFFENTKDMLDQCDQNKPRFHAFLKICQTKPECGRQSLKELLIKPVQRLPSISLLLNDILKHTNKSNPDHSALEKSLSSIKEVMTYINEDKRKTEGQLQIFDIFNEIENCPPHLVSSHRQFISKCEVQELSEGLSGRGDRLVLFLFSDTLEICKKRSKVFNHVKSPNTVNGSYSTKSLNQEKPYKHVKMLSLSTVKKVYDIRETEECRNVFALLVRSNQELKDKLYSFTITDEEVNKTNYLRQLCRQMANTVCKADADTFLISLDSHQLEIDTSDVALGTLSKAFKFATRTRMKVGRAFSFNKTPSKLKRAMSTMMSPFGSTHSLTPASQQLAQMRLASCNNINELGNGGSNSPSRDEVLVAPMSVQPTRKAKCSTLSMASLRRNCSAGVMEEESDS